MSMNLTLHFEDSKGRTVREVDLIQTPTATTYAILDVEGSKLEAYCDWVRSSCTCLNFDYYCEAHISEVCDLFEKYSDYIPVWAMI